MKRQLVPVLVLLACGLAATAAAQQTYIRFNPAIAGEATESNHVGWITGYSLQWGVGRAISTTGPGGGEASLASFSEITLTKLPDLASATTAIKAAAGSSSDVEIHVCRVAGSGGVICPYKLFLRTAWLSSYSFASGGCFSPDCGTSESFSLAFTKLTWQYRQYDGGGKVLATKCEGYDVAKALPTTADCGAFTNTP